MNLIQKARTLLSIDSKTFMMYAEAYCSLGVARIQKSLPFTKIAPKLGRKMEETSLTYVPAHTEILELVSKSLETMSRYTFWESKCLVMAIAGMRMLERRGIESTLYMATARDKEGKMKAHAWLRSGLYFVTGANGKEGYTVVGTFAKRMGDQKEKK
ncbi:lasso peptide biosynthesis B2 protein [Bacillus sp. E214]|uniref:lasso peptide biosynthesis B2 protein n=1 Tax=Bacillus sp. E214 TaxID=2587156 RepID=UPI0011DFDEA2|nr:lasso peptide biosynthesis B2 protein [Bacillus sp. E214]